MYWATLGEGITRTNERAEGIWGSETIPTQANTAEQWTFYFSSQLFRNRVDTV